MDVAFFYLKSRGFRNETAPQPSERYKYFAVVFGAPGVDEDIVTPEREGGFNEVFSDLFKISTERNLFLRECGGFRTEVARSVVRDIKKFSGGSHG